MSLLYGPKMSEPKVVTHGAIGRSWIWVCTDWDADTTTDETYALRLSVYHDERWSTLRSPLRHHKTPFTIQIGPILYSLTRTGARKVRATEADREGVGGWSWCCLLPGNASLHLNEAQHGPFMAALDRAVAWLDTRTTKEVPDDA